ncbi:dolichyl-phosphate-mannose--protein mannosyltransferase [Bacteriovorax sp. Seq25_V]|uniref:dolichyl-phosphate-mannose--protein mannosyltransferase n=1 Tax=Bacteriovorax sp. Seq25_V TaxID=1201288 RepID=UPI000389FE1A|nr:dolichyl-phosphate-mannose--protein mannosyltransferase [Bacteriovorax sp. Seq25_V]EQC46825.1 dolichyl-phosphate-mannose-protein mannosyltransferase [Bacteriovorax sp. Seq25_V]
MRKINILLFVVIQFIISFYCLSFGDDTSLGLIDGWVRIGNNSFESLVDFSTWGIIKSNVEPVVAFSFGSTTIPLLFQARETGFIYIIIKLLSVIIGPVFALQLVNLILVCATFYFLDKILSRFFSKDDQPVALALMVLSPVLMYFGGPYYPDKFIFFFTVLLAYQILEKKSAKYVILTATLGLLTKFIFILNIILVLLAFGDKKRVLGLLKTKTFKVVFSFLTVLLAFIVTKMYDQFYYEFVTDHNIFKSSFFNLEYLRHMAMVLVDQRSYLEYFIIGGSSKGYLVLSCLVNIAVFLGLRFTNAKKMVVSIFAYFILLYFAIYEFSNASDYFTEALVVLLILKGMSIAHAPKEYKKGLIVLVLILSAWEFGAWFNGMTTGKLRGEIALSEKLKVMNLIQERGANQVIVVNKYDLGVYDFLSEGKIKGSFFDKDTFQYQKQACVLGYYSYKFGGAYAGEEQTNLRDIYTLTVFIDKYKYSLEDVMYEDRLFAYLGCKQN